MSIKAWDVDEISYEKCTVVYAETVSKAKLKGSYILEVPYLDVRVKRAYWADGLPHKEGEIDFDNQEVAEILRDMGWYQNDDSLRCAECGNAVWDILEHSYLVDGVCGDCREKANNEISY